MQKSSLDIKLHFAVNINNEQCFNIYEKAIHPG